MTTFAVATPEAIALAARHKAVENMFAEVLVILKKYETQDSGIFYDYVDLRQMLFSMANMQTKLNAQMKALGETVEN